MSNDQNENQKNKWIISAVFTSKNNFNNLTFRVNAPEYPESFVQVKQLCARIKAKFPELYSPINISHKMVENKRQCAWLTIDKNLSNGERISCTPNCPYEITFNIVKAESMKGKPYIKLRLMKQPKRIESERNEISESVLIF